VLYALITGFAYNIRHLKFNANQLIHFLFAFIVFHLYWVIRKMVPLCRLVKCKASQISHLFIVEKMVFLMLALTHTTTNCRRNRFTYYLYIY